MTAPRADLPRIVDGLLGQPFVMGAKGPGEWYCITLYLHLLEAAAGISIPDPFQPEAGIPLLGFWRRFQRLPSFADLHPLDALFWRWGGGLSHVVAVESPRWAVQITPGTGVHRVPLEDVVRRAERAYRPLELL